MKMQLSEVSKTQNDQMTISFAETDISFQYCKTEYKLFRAMAVYACSPFMFHPKHDFIEFSNDGLTASLPRRLSPHSNAVFGPILNASYINRFGLKFCCQFTPKRGNVGVAIVPSKWKTLNSYLIQIADPKMFYIYQNGWSRDSAIHGRTASNR